MSLNILMCWIANWLVLWHFFSTTNKDVDADTDTHATTDTRTYT